MSSVAVDNIETVLLIKCHCELCPWGRCLCVCVCVCVCVCGGGVHLFVRPSLWNVGDNLGNVTIQTVQCLSPVRTTSQQELSQCEVLGTFWVMLYRSWLCWLHGNSFCLSGVTQRSVTLSARPEVSRYCVLPNRILIRDSFLRIISCCQSKDVLGLGSFFI
jgi:hypothetical protein